MPYQNVCSYFQSVILRKIKHLFRGRIDYKRQESVGSVAGHILDIHVVCRLKFITESNTVKLCLNKILFCFVTDLAARFFEVADRLTSNTHEELTIIKILQDRISGSINIPVAGFGRTIRIFILADNGNGDIIDDKINILRCFEVYHCSRYII